MNLRINELLKDEIKITELLNYALIHGNPSFKQKPSVVDVEEQEFTTNGFYYFDTNELANRISGYLQEFGIKKGHFARKVLNLSKFEFNRMILNKFGVCQSINFTSHIARSIVRSLTPVTQKLK